MDEFRTVLLDHWRRYPKMTDEDLVKLAFQSEFGPGHFVACPEQAWERIKAEYSACQRLAAPKAAPPVWESLGGEYCRINLRSLPRSGLSLATVCRWFVLSAAGLGHGAPTRERLQAKLELICELCRDNEIGIPAEKMAAFVEEYAGAGYPALHHSAAYREAYLPAYRVVRKEFAAFAAVFAAVDTLLGRKSRVLVAIDGHSGAGKSHLAQLLSQVYDCSVLHMDDFFLPAELKTSERLQEPGGNVHYERFAQEVLPGLRSGRPFQYGVFDCRTQRVSHTVKVEPKALTVVEGVYSMHPIFGDPYDLRVFLRVTRERQVERIRSRSGEALLARFVQEWIPLENRYFETFAVGQQADLLLDS